GDREKINTPVWKQNRAGNQDSENRAGGSDRRHVRKSMAKKSGHGFHRDVDQSRPYAGEKVIAQKFVSSPHHLQFAAEDPQHQHVHHDVQKKVDVVEEEIGERLPDPQTRQHSRGHEAEARQELVVAGSAGEVIDERFENENPEVCEQQNLHTRRDVKIEADAIALDARPGCHTSQVYGVVMRASKRRFGGYSLDFANISICSMRSLAKFFAGKMKKRRR